MVPLQNNSKRIYEQILEDLKNSKGLQPYQEVGLWHIIKSSDLAREDCIEKAYEVSRKFFHFKESDGGFSANQTRKYSGRIECIRHYDFEHPREDTQKIYRLITAGFKAFLGEMIQDALYHIGPVPYKCSFSFVVLGSLSREEMTPYSDFEYAILTNVSLDEEQKSYFVNLAHYLHHQILHLGETPLRELATGYFFSEDPIKKGFSLDGPLGGMAPNWDKCLIGTPQELACFQREKYFIEKRTFPGELRHSAFLYGDELLALRYQEQICNILNESEQKERALKLLDADLSRFDLRFGKVEESERVYTVKYETYRLLQLLIEGLSLYFDIKETSIWDRIRSLEEKGCFCQKGADNLLKAANTILHFRLALYREHRSAVESVSERDWDNEQWIKVYQVLLPFSSAVDQFLDTRDSKHLFKNTFACTEDEAVGSYYQLSNQYREAYEKFAKVFAELPETDLLKKAELLNRMGNCQLFLSKEKAKKCFLKVFEISNNSDKPFLLILKLRMASIVNLAAYHRYFCNFETAIKCLIKAQECVDQYFFHRSFAQFTVYSNLGVAYSTARQFKQAEMVTRKALEIQKTSERRHPNTALVSYNLGETLCKLEKYDEAEQLFDEGAKIAKSICGSFHYLSGEACKGKALVFFERALKSKEQERENLIDQSIENHQKALEIFVRDLGEDSDEVITQLCNLGVVWACKNFDNSQDFFSKAETKMLKKDPKKQKVRYWGSFYSQSGLACRQASKFEMSRNFYYLSLNSWLRHVRSLPDQHKDRCSPEMAFRFNNYAMSVQSLAFFEEEKEKAYELLWESFACLKEAHKYACGSSVERKKTEQNLEECSSLILNGISTKERHTGLYCYLLEQLFY